MRADDAFPRGARGTVRASRVRDRRIPTHARVSSPRTGTRRKATCGVAATVNIMTQPLEGIRVLEVDNWGFAPSAGVVLADWGADVVKVEPPGRGDPLRAIFGALNWGPGAAFNF